MAVVYKFMGKRILLLSDVHRSARGYCTARQKDVTNITNLILGMGLCAQAMSTALDVIIEGGGMDTTDAEVCNTPEQARRYRGPLPDTYCALTDLGCLPKASQVPRAKSAADFFRARTRRVELREVDDFVGASENPHGRCAFYQLDLRWQCGMQSSSATIQRLLEELTGLLRSETEMRPGTEAHSRVRKLVHEFRSKAGTHDALRKWILEQVAARIGVSVQDVTQVHSKVPASFKKDVSRLADLQDDMTKTYSTFYDGQVAEMLSEYDRFGAKDVVPLSSLVALHDAVLHAFEITIITESCLLDAMVLSCVAGLDDGRTVVVYAGDAHIQRYVVVLERAGAERVFQSDIKHSRCTQIDMAAMYP